MKPLMQTILDEELKKTPEKDKEKEQSMAGLGQELLDVLWVPEKETNTLWGKLKDVLSDGINLPQKLFDRIVDFRVDQGLSDKKEEMQKVMFYATMASRKGTDILARACYLFRHNPKAFEKYATTSVDFSEDMRQSAFDEENMFMPTLDILNGASGMATGQFEQAEARAYNRRLPLLSFSPIKYGKHPCIINNPTEISKYEGLFSEISLRGWQYDPARFSPLKNLLYAEHPESNYPAQQHEAIVIAINEFSRHLEREPVKVCTHKNKTKTADKQNQH